MSDFTGRNNKIGRVVEPGKVDFINREIAPLGPGQVLVKIVSSSICGSDLHIFKGKHPSVSLPVTIGHEFSGEVVEVGSGVKAVSVGDRVTVEPVVVCGKCEQCRHGNYGYCENISFTYRNGDGAMAEYIAVLEPYVYKLPDYLSYDAGALMEPLAVATHAVRRADIKLGEKVLVIGGGAIGTLVAALCRRNGAGEVAIVDFSSKRLKLALEFGATIAINPREDGVTVEEAVEKLTNGTGMDKTFDCVGSESTFVQAMMTLRKNGLATIVGISENPQIQIPVSRFVTHEIKVQGSQGYCWDFPIALKVAKELDIERMVSHRFKLDELQQALETCMDRESGAVKVIIKP
jgi:Threonine dehydrogenase and related Zn-dependent dehydrogenases